jgi:hypothetical protein
MVEFFCAQPSAPPGTKAPADPAAAAIRLLLAPATAGNPDGRKPRRALRADRCRGKQNVFRGTWGPR